MDIKVKNKSYGFRGRHWDKIGEIIHNVTPEELKMPEMKHFTYPDGTEIIKYIKLGPVVNENKEPSKPEELDDKSNVELRNLLDEKKIEYPSNASTAQLINILKSVIPENNESDIPPELIGKTNNELKALLDEKGIAYPASINKAGLIELLTGGGA
ncbi:MAG TPA: hypothetical protein DDW50_20990 [Firmicutes bacterium]|jgi:hypothetical protein|nr:hypothetical protein [Bacillota bacterium]